MANEARREKGTTEGGRQQGTDDALYVAFRERAMRNQWRLLGKGLTWCSRSQVRMQGREEHGAGGQEVQVKMAVSGTG